MEIKPTGPGGPQSPAPDNSRTVKKFTKASQPGAASGTEQPFQAISTEFRRADLQDPAKVDQALSRCSGELLQSSLERTGTTASPADTANLTEFLKDDPVIRGKLLSYLERVLT